MSYLIQHTQILQAISVRVQHCVEQEAEPIRNSLQAMRATMTAVQTEMATAAIEIDRLRGRQENTARVVDQHAETDRKFSESIVNVINQNANACDERRNIMNAQLHEVKHQLQRNGSRFERGYTRVQRAEEKLNQINDSLNKMMEDCKKEQKRNSERLDKIITRLRVMDNLTNKNVHIANNQYNKQKERITNMHIRMQALEKLINENVVRTNADTHMVLANIKLIEQLGNGNWDVLNARLTLLELQANTQQQQNQNTKKHARTEIDQ